MCIRDSRSGLPETLGLDHSRGAGKRNEEGSDSRRVPDVYKRQPLVTAVIPVYNHEKYVIESIRSIVGQSYDNIELIVINDGSTDHSHELILTIVEECKQRCRRFEYINRDNIGLSATLNQALDMACLLYTSQGPHSNRLSLPLDIEGVLSFSYKVRICAREEPDLHEDAHREVLAYSGSRGSRPEVQGPLLPFSKSST